MTSLSPFDALRALLPGLGRDIGPGALLPGLEADDDSPGTEGRRGDTHWRASDAHAGHAHLRDGTNPLPHAGNATLAETLADALRQNPSHPLFRELQQLSPDTLRQLIQMASQQPGNDALAAQVEPLARVLAQAMAEARNAAQHPASTDLRATAQALAQQVAQDRAVAPGREALAAAFVGRAEDARAAMAMPGGQAASDASQRALPSTPMTLLARGDGLPAGTHAPSTTASPPPGSVASPAASQDSAAQPPLHARLVGDALPVGRADTAAASGADPGSSGGLLGLAGAAGVTLAAVGNPAGTTHAVAPQTQSRLRQTEDAKHDARKRVSEDEMQDDGGGGHREGDPDGEAARQRGPANNGDSSGDGDAIAQQHGHRDNRAPASPGIAKGAESHAGENMELGAGPAAGESQAATEASTVAGHTAALGLLLPRYGGTDDVDDDARAQGRADDLPADEDPEVRHSRRLRWLYWALIAIAYGCLGVALATLAPAWSDLPAATQARTPWRHGLTAVGLASALWAWLLARRIR